MQHDRELLKQLREELAKEQGYSSFASMANNVNIVPSDLITVAKRYAEKMYERWAAARWPEPDGSENLAASQPPALKGAEARVQELEIVLYLLLKSFKQLATSDIDIKRVEDAEYVLNKDFDIKRVLRSEFPTAAGELPADVIDKILKARDALVERDVDEAYHQLYSIASPYFDKLEPWAQLEAKLPLTAAGDGKAREAIEDILLKTSKHNPEQCSELADAILKDMDRAGDGKEAMEWKCATDEVPGNNNLVHLQYSTDNTRFKLTGFYEPNEQKWYRQDGKFLEWAPNLEWLYEPAKH